MFTRSRRAEMAFDCIVIGGGPAGMIAAITAARAGKNVVLLEKNDRLGKKLLITGKGRCNVTNNCTADEVLKNTPGTANSSSVPWRRSRPPWPWSFLRTRGVR